MWSAANQYRSWCGNWLRPPQRDPHPRDGGRVLPGAAPFGFSLSSDAYIIPLPAIRNTPQRHDPGQSLCLRQSVREQLGFRRPTMPSPQKGASVRSEGLAVSRRNPTIIAASRSTTWLRRWRCSGRGPRGKAVPRDRGQMGSTPRWGRDDFHAALPMEIAGLR